MMRIDKLVDTQILPSVELARLHIRLALQVHSTNVSPKLERACSTTERRCCFPKDSQSKMDNKRLEASWTHRDSVKLSMMDRKRLVANATRLLVLESTKESLAPNVGCCRNEAANNKPMELECHSMESKPPAGPSHSMGEDICLRVVSWVE